MEGSEANLQALHAAAVPALTADGLMRRRDERLAQQGRYKALPDPLYDKASAAKPSKGKFQPSDFIYDPASRTCICPAGKKLYSTGSACFTHGRKHLKFQRAKRDCVPCSLRDKCLRYPQRTQTRQAAFFERNQNSPLPYIERMKRAIDSSRAASSTGGASRSSSPCSPTCATTSAWAASTCAACPK